MTQIQKLKMAVVAYAINLLWTLDLLARKNYAKVFNLHYKVVGCLILTGLIFNFALIPTKNLVVGVVRETKLGAYAFFVPQSQAPIAFANTNSANVLSAVSRKSEIPILTNKKAFPFVTAKAHLVIDRHSGSVLSRNNESMTFAPASTTKLMTALVAADIYTLDEVLTVSKACTLIDSTKLWLPEESTYTVKDLLYGMLIGSAADAACVLSSSKISQADFVSLMNEKAISLGFTDTHFTNTIGLDGFDGSHYSTASDLYKLANAAVSNEVIRDIVKTKEHQFSPQNTKLSVKVQNTNKLLWDVSESVGIKTGTTEGAGEVLIYEYKDGEKDIVIVVMGSLDRFSDTKNILNWVLSSYSWEN